MTKLKAGRLAEKEKIVYIYKVPNKLILTLIHVLRQPHCHMPRESRYRNRKNIMQISRATE